ncbi:sugar transporter (hexose transporter) [Penicillium malachiteum]|uniref:sugar transporter (hexose transporter) n=1 Tax=Penicillium malachiteum TaxID=1324776 RepID=UPI002548A9D5|nr:sugar transporter (hexose transporter) [Penicillium malachiteum]KAJ5729569.1 sugar transporter (hexose transporter) [Penicillium malachiteum]
MSNLASEETNNESQDQPVNVPFDYTVPHVSILKATYLWKASFCVAGLRLFCESPYVRPALDLTWSGYLDAL